MNKSTEIFFSSCQILIKINVYAICIETRVYTYKLNYCNKIFFCNNTIFSMIIKLQFIKMQDIV